VTIFFCSPTTTQQTITQIFIILNQNDEHWSADHRGAGSKIAIKVITTLSFAEPHILPGFFARQAVLEKIRIAFTSQKEETPC
jgi:Na+/proline symporter